MALCVWHGRYIFSKIYMLCTNVEHLEHEMDMHRFDEDTRSLQLTLMPDIHPGDIYTL